MELATLLQTLADNGFALGMSGCTANAVEVRGPTQRLTPTIREALRQHKPALVSLLGRQTDPEREAIQTEHLAPPEATAFPFGANIPDWWDLLTDADRAALEAPRERKGQCFYCGGRGHHHRDCFAMPHMPWGKHVGTPLPAVPDSYLRFVIDEGIGGEDAKRMLRNEWERRYR